MAVCSPPIAAIRRSQKTLHPKVILGSAVIEHESGFTNQRSLIEIIIHDHKYVHIVGFTFCGNEGTEYDKSGQTAGLRPDLMDTFEPTGEQFAPTRTSSEATDRFRERCRVNARR